MKQSEQSKLRELTARLNTYRDEYYNKNAPSVSDEVYDVLFEDLKVLEQTLGIRMANSPTQTVGYPAVSKLEKTNHSIPLLSLEKTKSSMDLVNFQGERQIMLMLKLDGLTVKLTYENGKLVQAATRGDGNVGEVITHNVRGISGIPMTIPYKERLVVTGEAFIHTDDFEELKGTLLDSTGNPYKNGRNLAAGSVRLLDAAVCKERKVSFLPFNVLEGYGEQTTKSGRLFQLRSQGFPLFSFLLSNRSLSQQDIEACIAKMRRYAEEEHLPIDGMVMSYNDTAYSQQCGRTGHHYKDGIAFKFEDDTYETVLREIEWNPTRTGEIVPVAVFDTVEIDGCNVSRASLHNLTFLGNLELMPGNRILVSKRNQIIPHVEDNIDRGAFAWLKILPKVCPCCGMPTKLHSTQGADGKLTRRIFCDNPHCVTRNLRRFVHFVSQKAMNIEGLSEATLEKFIGKGWLHSCLDLYCLDQHRAEIVAMDGFGEKSWLRLWNAIQRSRETTFEKYLIAMDIPMIGRTASKTLSLQFHEDLSELENAVYEGFDFTRLPDFGETLHNNIHAWFCEEENIYIWEELQKMVHIEKTPAEEQEMPVSSPFAGRTIVVTGKVEPYTRNGMNALIESLGARAGSAVSKNTDYLVCGENAGSKLSKAKALGITVLTPDQFFQMANL